ncbi:hypothetical protein FRC04_008432 [Tulasnella sp. 424]|nr:hypothetical protein FRC04_008432 [Tulasnella sp. 424]KAG8976802.1 hypothetical protein FRC05_003152 [Tulasnella sp. 425]
MEAQSLSAARAVHFSQSCVLILDHELTVPSQSPSGAAGAIFRAFNPIAKGFALHLPTTLGGRASSHARRSSSTESSSPQVTDDSPGATSPRLGRRVSGARKNSLTTYPPVQVQLPLRSCLKSPNRDIPPTPISPTPPGAFHHSPPPSPVHVRGRSMSRSSPPPNSVSTSPPPAPAHHLCIPTEIIPLQPCCDTCNEATDLAYSMGNSYRISWSAAAAAKKKRDDEEERGDILAGLKRACNYKWNRVLDGDDAEDDDDDGFCGPIPDQCPGLHATSCPPGSSAALDPLSKLDGLSRSPAASTSSLNKDWTPQKYYDSEDEDQDLFPLPSPSMSPQPSPVTGSPASSATHLPSANRPISPLVPTNDKFPPVARSYMHGQVSLGLLPPIAGSAPASPAAGSARSSVVSLSDAGSGRSRGSVQSHHSRGPSPIHVAASTNAARQHLDATSVATASTGSSSRTGSSGRMWTTSFVPPPLPTRKDLQSRKLVGAEGTSKSPLIATGATAKSTNLNTTAAAKLKGERDRGERAHPPPMPTYSGAQREFMIVASSKDRDRERERERVSTSQQPKQRSKEYGEKALPPPPPIKDPVSTPNYENTSDSTPVGSRSGSMARRNGGSPYEDYFEDATIDLSLSRVPTATVLNTPKSTRSYYPAQEDDQLGPLTSPVTSPAKRRGGSISQQQQQQPTPPRTLMRAGSGQNLKISTSSKTLALEDAVAAAASSREGRQHRRSSTAADVVDESGVLVATTSRGGGDSSRNRASSIKRLWKGIGSVASGIGAAAGAI